MMRSVHSTSSTFTGTAAGAKEQQQNQQPQQGGGGKKKRQRGGGGGGGGDGGDNVSPPPRWVQRLSPVLRNCVGGKGRARRLARLAPAWPAARRIAAAEDDAARALRALSFWGVSMSAAARACPRLALGALMSCALRALRDDKDRYRPALPPNQRNELRGREDALDFVVRLDRPQLLNRLSARHLLLGLDLAAEGLGLETFLVRRDAARCLEHLLIIEADQQQSRTKATPFHQRIKRTAAIAAAGGGAANRSTAALAPAVVSLYRLEHLIEFAGRYCAQRVMRDIIFRQPMMRPPPQRGDGGGGGGGGGDHRSSNERTLRSRVIEVGIRATVSGDSGGDSVDGPRAALLLSLFEKLPPERRSIAVQTHLASAAKSGKWASWYIMHRRVARWAPTVTQQVRERRRADEVRDAMFHALSSRSWRSFLERLEAAMPAAAPLPWPADAAVLVSRDRGAQHTVAKLRWALAHGAAWTEQLESEAAEYRRRPYNARISAETATWIEQERARRDAAAQRAQAADKLKAEQAQRKAELAQLKAERADHCAAAAAEKRAKKKSTAAVAAAVTAAAAVAAAASPPSTTPSTTRRLAAQAAHEYIDLADE